ncbi:hypothetical protein OAU50_03320 [Planctomycetota bacterium]|nr:hypothetical protein [Planctomycetota bacterium]
MEYVWVFNGANMNFPSGVFSTRERAEEWIQDKRLTGTLTRYPVDVSAYDHSIANGTFRPKGPQHETPEFIGKFSGGEVHFHYEDGQAA